MTTTSLFQPLTNGNTNHEIEISRLGRVGSHIEHRTKTKTFSVPPGFAWDESGRLAANHEMV
jgi:hypothetical protein